MGQTDPKFAPLLACVDQESALAATPVTCNHGCIVWRQGATGRTAETKMDAGTNGGTKMMRAAPLSTRSRLNLALAAAMVATLVTTGLPALAYDTVFTMANYPVEARAKDAVTAKNTAVADGQQAALRSLMRRLVPVTAYKRLRALPPIKATNMVDGVAVKAERNSSTEYIATLDFSFQPAAVRDMLRRNGIPFVDQQAPPTVLIPLFRAGPSAPYETGQGVWHDAWKGLDLTHTLSPLKLEPLKKAIVPDQVQALIKSTNGADPIFTSEYKTERLVVAVAEVDPAGKRLVVTLVGTDAVGPFNLQRTYRIAGSDTAYTAELAAIVGLGVMEGRWKAGKAGAVGGIEPLANDGVTIQLVVEFATLAEWNDVRARLLDADGAFDVSVGTVSARSADVSLRHPGGPSALTQSLATSGLTMRNAGGSWVVRSTF